MPKLGVNVDHVATIRQARRTNEPDPVWAAAEAQLGGADGITIHLREDRRHIQDRDLQIMKETVSVKLNLECACVPEMIAIACQAQPDQVCLVPERREEVTTEGGLDVIAAESDIAEAVEKLHASGIEVSVFIDPNLSQIEACSRIAADTIELHTGQYALAQREQVEIELSKIREAAELGAKRKLWVDAGHGLTYTNVLPVAKLPWIRELNIGHSIISRSVFCGIRQAVADMKRLVV